MKTYIVLCIVLKFRWSPELLKINKLIIFNTSINKHEVHYATLYVLLEKKNI